MKSNKYKKVNCPIYVPKWNHCWNWETQEICPQFDNNQGAAICEITSDYLQRVDDGYIKLPWCLALKDWEDE